MAASRTPRDVATIPQLWRSGYAQMQRGCRTAAPSKLQALLVPALFGVLLCVLLSCVSACGGRVTSGKRVIHREVPADAGVEQQSVTPTPAVSTAGQGPMTRHTERHPRLQVTGDAPLPTACEEPTGERSASACTTRAACQDDEVTVKCAKQAGGIWSCTCEAKAFSASFEVTDGDSGACDAVAAECLAENEELDFEAECTTSEELQTLSCDGIRTCHSFAETAPGIRVVRDDKTTVNCRAEPSQVTQCSCDSGVRDNKYFELEDITLEDACPLTLELCDEPIDLNVPPECSVSYQIKDDTQCQLGESCRGTVSISDKVVAVATDRPNATCAKTAEGRFNCDCSSRSRELSFSVSEDTFVSGGCEQAVGVCVSQFEPEPVGPIACEVEANSDRTTEATQDCHVDALCTREVEADCVTLLLDSRIQIRCDPDAEDWRCACEVGARSAELQVAMAEGLEPCSEAAKRCPDLIDVAIGAGTSF